MLIGIVGLILVAVFGNIGYYEFMYKKPIKKDKDLIPGYTLLIRRRKKKLVGTFNSIGDSDTKSGTGSVDDFNGH